MSREWWLKTAPKLAIGFKILAIGVQIACAGLPLVVNPQLYETMKNEVDFIKELASHLELERKTQQRKTQQDESRISIEEWTYNDRVLHHLRQVQSKDVNRITQIQLAELLENIAPDNYRGRQWGSLRRVRMPDNTYRWFCDEHAKKLGR